MWMDQDIEGSNNEIMRLLKATFHLTICMRGQRTTGKIQRNNYHHGSCGPSLTGKTMSVFLIFTQGTHRNAKNRWVRSRLNRGSYEKIFVLTFKENRSNAVRSMHLKRQSKYFPYETRLSANKSFIVYRSKWTSLRWNLSVLEHCFPCQSVCAVCTLMYGLSLSQSDRRAFSYFNQCTINFHLGCENQVILEFLRAYHGFIYHSLSTLKQRLIVCFT